MSQDHNLGGDPAGGRSAAPRVPFVLLLVLVATGCGSDSTEPTGITGPGYAELPAWNPTTQLSPLRRLLTWVQ